MQWLIFYSYNYFSFSHIVLNAQFLQLVHYVKLLEQIFINYQKIIQNAIRIAMIKMVLLITTKKQLQIIDVLLVVHQLGLLQVLW